jgi:hypothetical protein
MADVILFFVVAGILGGVVYMMASPNRYSKMSDQEFEEDTKKSSVLGSVIIGLERSLRRHEADLVIEEKLRTEKDATPSGDHPPEEYEDQSKEEPRS